MEGSKARLGAGWRDAFLSMPPWRFVLGAGLVTPSAWAGLMLPSVDAVGRYFPLTVATPLSEASLDLVATLLAAAPWFDAIEEIALSAIAPKADTHAIDAAFAARAFCSEWLRPGATRTEADSTVPMRSAQPQLLCVALDDRPLDDAAGTQLAAMGTRLAEPAAAWLAEPSEVMERHVLLTETLPSAAAFCAMMDGHWLEHGWENRELRGGGGR
jgi:type VI secretion system protein ImpM